MARYKRIPQNIGGVKTMTAHRDFADICPPCGRYVLRGQLYVLKGGQTYHYDCRNVISRIETKPDPQAERRRDAEVRREDRERHKQSLLARRNKKRKH